MAEPSVSTDDVAPGSHSGSQSLAQFMADRVLSWFVDSIKESGDLGIGYAQRLELESEHRKELQPIVEGVEKLHQTIVGRFPSALFSETSLPVCDIAAWKRFGDALEDLAKTTHKVHRQLSSLRAKDSDRRFGQVYRDSAMDLRASAERLVNAGDRLMEAVSRVSDVSEVD